MPTTITLRRGLITALLALPLLASAQFRNTVRFDPPTTIRSGSYSSQLLPAASGRWWLPGTSSWGSDSAQLNILRLTPGLTISASRQARVSAWRAGYNFAATPTALYCGGNVSTGSGGSPGHFLFGFDTTLATRWGVRFTNLHNGQGSFYGVQLQDPATLVMYSATTSQGGTTFHRTWGRAATGTSWRSRLITVSANVRLVGGALAHGPAGTHYLTGMRGGTGTASDAGMLIKLDTTKVYWGRQVSAGGTDEGLSPAIAAANGNVWIVLNTQPTTATPDQAVLCRFDTAGTLLSARRLIWPGRFLGINNLVELPGGGLLLAGYALTQGPPQGARNPILVRLDATGAVVWVRRKNVMGIGLGSSATLVPWPAGGYVLSLSDRAIAELDANFSNCEFSDEPPGTISSAPDNTLTVQPLTVSMTPFTPAFVPETLLPRTIPAFSRVAVCSAVAVADEILPVSVSLAAWPQPLPRGERLHLSLPAGWTAADTHLTLASTLGQLVWSGPWAEAVALPIALPSGVWTLTASNRSGNHSVLRLLTE